MWDVDTTIIVTTVVSVNGFIGKSLDQHLENLARWLDQGSDSESGIFGHGAYRQEVPLSVAPTTGSLNPVLLPMALQNDPVVTVEQGMLRGLVDTLDNVLSFYSFRGIPYAQPPVGSLRFLAPQPPQPWEGIRNATQYGDVCAQTDAQPDSVFEGSEDCLFVNVFTKSLDPTSKIPVMVFIHGGSYLAGSGNDYFYGPKFLLQQDVVVVTLNYRLEVLGFLCLDTPEVPGNAGMKDQVAALRWVKENIAQFGGDPDNITLFGESSGACSVTHHMISEMSRGLFNKAIAQSGNSLHDWAIGRDGKSRAFRVGKYLGIETNSTTVLLEYLRSMPAKSLTNLTVVTSTEDEQHRGLPERFIPIVEKEFPNVEPFLNENPIDALKSRKMRQMPFLHGYNSAEGILLIEDRLNKLEFYNKNPSYDVPREIAERVSQETMDDMGRRIRQFYVGDREFTKDDYKEIVKMLSDVHFVYNTHRLLYMYSEYNSPIYFYRFSFDTDLNIIKQYSSNGLDIEGACHGDEIFYMFSNNFTKTVYESQEKLRNATSEVTKLWTDYANTSNPTPDGCSGTKWPPYTLESEQYFNIDEELTLGQYAEKERVAFWDTLYCEAGLPCINNN